MKVDPTFFQHIDTQITGTKPWLEYQDGQKTDKQLGASVEVVILKDSYPGYEPNTNQYEKFSVKVQGASPDKFKLGEQVKVVNIKKATFYGDNFDRKLSCEAQLLTVAEYNAALQRRATEKNKERRA